MSEQRGSFDHAVAAFFAIHALDPKVIDRPGASKPWSVFYHERMLAWLEKLAPDASEPLRLAAACQHIRRWKIPRDTYPEGKVGYRKWRRDLAEFHGEEAAAVLREVGYSAELIARVRALLLKTDLGTDPEVQTLEDAACLVFLENEFAAFAEKHSEEKILVILRKTWKKMSPRGRDEASKLIATLPEDARGLVYRALA